MNEELIRGILSILNDTKKRECYNEYIEEIREIAEDLKPHFDEDYPAKLLNIQHEGESEWMKVYRKERWQPPTRSSTGRVFTSLQKIQQADDFKILFAKEGTGIIEENSLEKYLTYDLPKFKNLEVWLFTVFLKSYLENPNGVVITMPDLTEWIDSDGEVLPDFLAPFPQIFEEEDVIYRREKEIIVKVEGYKTDGKEYDRFLAIHSGGYVLLKQISEYKDGENVFQVFPLEYQFVKFPVVSIGSVISEIEDGNLIYDSILSPCLPSWNEVLFRSDDLMINWALHSNPIFWRVRNTPCKTCNGTGERILKDNSRGICTSCNGNGLGSDGSPFATIEINPQKSNATNPAMDKPIIDPAGYIKLDNTAIKSQKEDINDNIYKGFQAIGLELLANVPAPQSGIAKQYDRKELNTFFFQVAVHLSFIYEEVSTNCFIQRYRPVIDNGLINSEQFQKNIPRITIPSDFDVLTTDILSQNLSQAIKDGFDPLIISGLSRDYTEKLFGENSMQLKILKIRNQLDPLPYKTDDEKLVLKESMGCTELDYITSAYLPTFINLKMEENPNWADLDRKIQRADIMSMAVEKQKEIKAGIVPIMP